MFPLTGAFRRNFATTPFFNTTGFIFGGAGNVTFPILVQNGNFDASIEDEIPPKDVSCFMNAQASPIMINCN